MIMKATHSASTIRLEQVGSTVHLTVVTDGGAIIEFGLLNAKFASETVGEVSVVNARGEQALYMIKQPTKTGNTNNAEV